MTRTALAAGFSRYTGRFHYFRAYAGFKTGAANQALHTNLPLEHLCWSLPNFVTCVTKTFCTHNDLSLSFPYLIFSMTLPANDVFTLGLAHDDSTKRLTHSRSRSLTRSPSPKIPFSSDNFTSRSSRVERGLARKSGKRVRKGGAVANGNLAEITRTDVVHIHTNGSSSLEEIEEKREESPVHVSPEPTKKGQPIDWEFPRKLLHSSIGASVRYLDLPLVKHDSMGIGFLTLYLYSSHGSPQTAVVVIGTALVTVIAPTEIIRLRSPHFEKLYERHGGFLMRESEKVGSMFSGFSICTMLILARIRPTGCLGTFSVFCSF
jgi:hypothetical protein